MEPDPAPTVDPQETLYVAPRKRFVPVYFPNEEGNQELVLHVGTKEIAFDEPDLFPWAEKLIEQDSFLAGSATGWSTTPLEWPRIRGLLGDLLDAGVLARERPATPTVPPGPISQVWTAFIEYEQTRKWLDTPRFWNPDPGPVLREIAGRGVEVGYIETVVPQNRIAHIAFDREGRQVGEINSFPDTLRMKLPTEWKPCGYAGTRYLSEMPMNMTALRAMINHWRPVLQATLLCREEFLKRFPRSSRSSESGRWKLGEVLYVSSCVLALPSLQLMRWENPVPSGQLDPVLSSLFRVIDGVRMISAHLLDLYERPMVHDTPVGPKDITEGAEREDQYRSGRGVCAGPQSMIDELVDTLMNGKPLQGEPPALGPWAADIPLAMDYGLRGVQLHAATFIVWVRMGLAYTRIIEVLERAPGLTSGTLGKLREAIERDFQMIAAGRMNLAVQRDFSEPYYHRMYDNAQRGIRGLAQKDYQQLEKELTPPDGLLHERARAAFADLFASSEEPEYAAAHAEVLQEIAGYVLDYLRYERNALRTIDAVQREINTLLKRPQPKQPLSGDDLAILLALRRMNPGRGLRYLLETVREVTGIAVDNQKDGTTVTRGGRSLVLP
jgi:hypothetical protein